MEICSANEVREGRGGLLCQRIIYLMKSVRVLFYTFNLQKASCLQMKEIDERDSFFIHSTLLYEDGWIDPRHQMTTDRPMGLLSIRSHFLLLKLFAFDTSGVLGDEELIYRVTMDGGGRGCSATPILLGFLFSQQSHCCRRSSSSSSRNR